MSNLLQIKFIVLFIVEYSTFASNNKVLLEAADKFGTPLYIYDSNMIKSQYNRLKQSFKDVKNLQINYAVKALSNISILKYMINWVQELTLYLFKKLNLHLRLLIQKYIHTNGVSIEEIKEVSELGVSINIDNLEVLEQFGNLNPDIPVCIRINPI